jgi:hypothetical protein
MFAARASSLNRLECELLFCHVPSAIGYWLLPIGYLGCGSAALGVSWFSSLNGYR